ncbi:putative LPS assembly protein LptD [Lewinella sp. JB7]|uniref:putative LPS assembly protein LptD n=1 Tax=Lewinella sp. JB7 TaxID=2962887 RepID=UPI0020C9D3AB|nr:putative LPS assembly protein LptD [Lewinella sp. JB7]MCP9237580.1 putative LPS assembly protein LptD [Lewinella sp. JB7]
MTKLFSHPRTAALLYCLLFVAVRAGAQVDSIPERAVFSGSTADYRMSPDSLDAPVEYSSEDSMDVDLVNQRIHLYGNARVNYQDVSLEANHIVLDYGQNVVSAEPWPDSSGTQVGDPKFSDGGQEFTAKGLTYNFKSRKGIVTETVTTQDDVYVRGGKSKFVSGGIATNDSTRSDVIYTEGAIFTSCSLDHPHFGIRTQRAKVVPNKLAIIGPSNLEIMGVPTPFWLPFGFFPLKSGRSSGLLFPSDYQYSPQWGFGFQGIGWFFPLGEHVNLTATSDIYLNGTFTVNAASSYRRRYKYSGSANFSYRRLVDETSVSEGLQPIVNQGITLGWSHRQDQRAHPTFNFGGSINFQTNLADQRYLNTYESASTNIIRSSMNITKSFPKLKSTLTAGLTHSQNNQTGAISVSFPDASFQTQTIYPLRNLPGSQRAWYKKLSFRYNSQLKTEFAGQDTSFFTQQTFDEARYGFRHDVSTALSLNVLKYFNVSPNASYAEVYYGKTLEYFLDPSTIDTEPGIDEDGNVTVDTISFASINSRLNPGLASYRTYSAGVSVSTQLFGTVRLGERGLFGLKGLRHVMKPTVTVGYSPDYRNATDFISGTPYFIRETDIDPVRGNANRFVTPFQGQIFGTPSSSQESFGVSYSIANLFEAKVYNRKDSTDNIVKLFQNIAVSGNYELTADSLQWSAINVSGGTSFFKGLTQVSLRANFDPYVSRYDPVTDQVDRIGITTLRDRGAPVQLNTFNGTISTNLTVAKIRELFQGQEEEYVTDVVEERRRRREDENTLFEETDILSLFEKFSIRHTLNYRLDREVSAVPGTRDTLRFNTHANSIELRGALQLTENWSVNIGQIGYDFTSKSITYPYLSFARDLHCWEMRFSWAPQRNTYQFSIAVKPGTFDFLEVPINQNRYDGQNRFGN